MSNEGTAAGTCNSLAADRPYYQGEHRCHGMNLQAIAGASERVFAELKKWRVLRKLRCDPHRATHMARAIATLNHQERQSG